MSMLLSQPVTVTLSAVTARSTQLPIGIYQVTSDVKCWIRQGASGVNATTASNPLPADGFIKIIVTNTTLDGYIAGIAGGAGTLSIVSVPS